MKITLTEYQMAMNEQVERPAIKRMPSAVTGSIEQDPYKELRREIIHIAYSEENKSRGRTKEAVRMMLGPLTAARKNGETFEQLAQLMTKHGYPIAGSTLRTYYFELRSDSELKSIVREQAEILAETRRRLVDEQSKWRVQEDSANELANRKKGGLRNRPKLVSASEIIGSSTNKPDTDNESDNQLSASQSSVPRQSARPTQRPSRNPGGGSEPKPLIAKEGAANVSDKGKAPSIAELRRLAATMTEKAILPMDVVLKDGVHAYYADGTPLDLVLSQRQVRLLESGGRLVASTSSSDDSLGRTANNFVKLPKKL